MNSRPETDHDLLIIGGGLVGASLARAVSGLGLRIGVVEARPYDSPAQPSYDERVLALSWGSRRILQSMGLWGRLESEAEPILKIHISERGQCGFARFDQREEGVEALGYVIPARTLGEVLLGGLDELPDVELICPARLEGLRVEADRVEARLAKGERRVGARLLVAADGGDSRVRRLLAIPLRESAYGQTAIIANVTPQRPHQGVAYERFTDSGPLAMLPMTGGRCSLVWTARDSQVEELLGLDERAFLERLQGRFGYRLGPLRKAGQRVAYPLRLGLAKQQTRPRVVLIGNAAHAIHPVSGQGFNLGIRDVAVLADLLSDVSARAADPGGEALLRAYGDWRKGDQQRVVTITDSLARLFANPLPPLRLARNLGLLGLDLTPPLKHRMVRQFMGLSGRLPRLARGVPLVR